MWLLLFLPMVLHMGFQTGTEGFQSSLRNPCTVTWVKSGAVESEGALKIVGDPQDRGRASAWVPIEGIGPISTDSRLIFWVRGNNKPMRVRIIFHPQNGSADYYHWWQNVEVSDKWQKVTIPLKNSRPLWSSNYPYVLTPGKKPDLFIFFENLEPGHFEVTVDEISLEKGGTR